MGADQGACPTLPRLPVARHRSGDTRPVYRPPLTSFASVNTWFWRDGRRWCRSECGGDHDLVCGWLEKHLHAQRRSGAAVAVVRIRQEHRTGMRAICWSVEPVVSQCMKE